MRIDRELFRTGVPVIDAQHEAYLDLVDRLFAQCQQPNVTHQALANDLDEVLAYAVEHFDTEQYLMQSKVYPYYKEHLAQHNLFRDHMDDFFAELRTDIPADTLTVRLTEWLLEWVAEHVQTNDRKFAAFLDTTRKRELAGVA